MTPDLYQSMIKSEMGIWDPSAIDPNTQLPTVLMPIPNLMVPVWWQFNADQGRSDLLNYYYTKQSVLRYLLGAARKRKDLVIGTDQIRANQEFTNLKAELDDWTKQLMNVDPDLKYNAPLLQITSPQYEGLDVVQEAYEYARQYDPYLFSDNPLFVEAQPW